MNQTAVPTHQVTTIVVHLFVFKNTSTSISVPSHGLPRQLVFDVIDTYISSVNQHLRRRHT